jgi:hypothetical protein
MNAESSPTDGDETLLAALRGALAEAEEVPATAVVAAKAAWTWRTIDAELAELVHDSTLDDHALAGVRGAATVRALSFTVGPHFVELEVTEDGERRSIVGQVMPAGTAGLVLEGADGRASVALAVDALGRFAAERLTPGLIRLRSDDGPLVTEWVAI